MHDGDAVALAAVPALGRRPNALNTAEMLEVVRKRFSPGCEQDEFVLKLAEDSGFRAACTEAIAGDAVPFGHPVRPAGSRTGTAERDW